MAQRHSTTLAETMVGKARNTMEDNALGARKTDCIKESRKNKELTLK